MTATDEIRLPLTSADLAAERLDALRDLFPEAFSEGKLDVERLALALGDAVATGPERYGLSWAGKADAMRAVQVPSVGTLVPAPEESVDFDRSENLFIEGDNLEVLKLLQKSYHGKVKMIYIDPPYNTGNDFIYPDNFREGLQDYLRYSGQVDANGFKTSTTSDTDGRIHSKWLSMMYPRLFLARNLLREDGVIFVSIDDHEIANLRLAMNDVFGEENFVAQFVWQSRQSVQNDVDVSVNHEYIVAYSRQRRMMYRRLTESNRHLWEKIPGFAAYPNPADPSRYDNPDADPRGPWKGDPFDAPNVRPNLTYPIVNPNTGEEHWPPPGRHWRTERENYQRLLEEKRVIFGKTGNSRPQLKVFYNEKMDTGETVSTWFEGAKYGTVTSGTQELQALFGGVSPFPFPKPTSLLKALIRLSTRRDDIVLDFFSGSGTIGHAVLDANREDGTDRRFVMTQLPEPIPADSNARSQGFETIADIGKERIRRVIAKLKQDQKQTLPPRIRKNRPRTLASRCSSSRRATSGSGMATRPRETRMD